MELILVIIILIILCIIYLCFRNYECNYTLEKFDEYTQRSLSTYYPNSVDDDQLENTKNAFNSFYNRSSIKVKWNGIWIGDNIYSQFLQNNDLLIISFSNNQVLDGSLMGIDNNYELVIPPNLSDYIFSFTITYLSSSSIKLKITVVNEQYTSIPDGLSIKIYSINNTSNIVKIIGASNTKTNEIVINNDIGESNNKVIFMEQKKCFKNSFVGIGQLNEKRNYFILRKIFCNNYINDNINIGINQFSGYINDSYNEIQLFSDGKPAPIKLRLKEPFVFNSNNYPIKNTFIDKMMDNINTLPIVPKDTYDYMNFMPITALVNNDGNNLYVCDYLRYINRCNAFIIGYIDRLGNFKTLNTQFFGIDKSKNNLTLQSDIMNSYFNDPSKVTSVLKYYRDVINSGNNVNEIRKAVSLTSCLDKNNTNYNVPSNLFNKCKDNIKNYIQNFERIENDKYMPQVWQINKGKIQNMVSYCPVNISTFDGYSTVIKYVEYNGGNIYLSPVNGGLNQQLLFENINILNYSSINGTLLMNTNIKTLNNYYLIPSQESGFSENSNILRLSPEIKEDGKWLILGFNLNKITDLVTTLNNITF
jgi:hypothetical protein